MPVTDMQETCTFLMQVSCTSFLYVCHGHKVSNSASSHLLTGYNHRTSNKPQLSTTLPTIVIFHTDGYTMFLK